jgi:hypothetical protein
VLQSSLTLIAVPALCAGRFQRLLRARRLAELTLGVVPG